jgi:hypothetical protein
MNFEEAQENMNVSYYGGGTGVFASGLVWSIAGMVALFSSQQTSMLTLFFGGMFIHPLGMLLSKILKRSGNHHSENPLGKFALENTVVLFVGLFLAFSIAQLRIEWFYPIMLIIIGARYMTFQTLYGLKVYWLLGLMLITSGVGGILLDMPFFLGAFVGGGLEIVFSFIIIRQAKICKEIK